jgi:hypothetical protein
MLDGIGARNAHSFQDQSMDNSPVTSHQFNPGNSPSDVAESGFA